MSDLQKYDQWLSGVKYHDAVLSITSYGTRSALLQIVLEREPSPGTSMTFVTGDRFQVYSHIAIPYELCHADFIERVFLGVIYAEEHEAAEFFMVNGDQPFHPHRPGFMSRIRIPERLRVS